MNASLLIFGLGLLIRIWLIWMYPPVYGGDTVIHLRNYEHVLLGHQLPALQVLIFLTYKITHIPFAFRGVMALIGAAASAGFYLAAKAWTDQKTAFYAALFFVTNPFLNEISIVPFQEILMLGALCFAAYFFRQKRMAAASLVLGVACLTRYEAWIACPFFALDYLLNHRKTPQAALSAVALFCWAPLVWMGWHLGLSGPGSYVIEMPRSADRLVRLVYLGWIVVKNTPVPVLLFSLLGLYFLWNKRLIQERWVKMGGVFALLFGIAILFSAHGDNHEGSANAERFVSSREAAIPVAAVLLFAGLGAEFLLRNQRWKLLIRCVAAIAMVLGVYQSARFVRSEVSPPDIHLSYELARFADAHLQSGERMLISAKPFSNAALRPYLEKVKEMDGERGYQMALENMATEDFSPIDFQRTAVQSQKSNMLTASGRPDDFAWVAVWSDAEAKPGALPEEELLRDGPLSVAIYHRLGTKK